MAKLCEFKVLTGHLKPEHIDIDGEQNYVT